MNPKIQAEREELLHQLWAAAARVLLARINSTEPEKVSAALLREARAFLANQGVDHASMNRHPSYVAAALPAGLKLPTFDDDDAA